MPPTIKNITRQVTTKDTHLHKSYRWFYLPADRHQNFLATCLSWATNLSKGGNDVATCQSSLRSPGAHKVPCSNPWSSQSDIFSFFFFWFKLEIGGKLSLLCHFQNPKCFWATKFLVSSIKTGGSGACNSYWVLSFFSTRFDQFSSSPDIAISKACKWVGGGQRGAGFITNGPPAPAQSTLAEVTQAGATFEQDRQLFPLCLAFSLRFRQIWPDSRFPSFR